MKIEETALDHIRSRPRFKIYTDLSKEDFHHHLQNFKEHGNSDILGNINSETAVFTVKSNENVYWKPTLSLRAEHDSSEEKTVIRGVFGPSSAVWTFFMFLYFLFSILWMVFITMWFVTRQIGSTDFPWALTLSFVMLGLLALTYIASLIGQRKAKSEMQKLRRFAETTIETLEQKN